MAYVPNGTKSLNEIFSSFGEKEKTSVYVDAANFFYSCKNVNLSVDFDDLRKVLEQQCQIKSLNYFVAEPPEDIKDEKLNHTKKINYFLESTGWRVYRKACSVIQTATTPRIVKCNVDVDLAVTMVHDIHCSQGNVERIILVTGDKDYVSAVNILKHFARVTVMCSRQQLSADLRLAADDIIYLEDLRPHVDSRRFNPNFISTPPLMGANQADVSHQSAQYT